jgi:hypothetical protein
MLRSKGKELQKSGETKKRDRRQSLFISEKKENGKFSDLFLLPSDMGNKAMKPLG